MDDGIDAVRTIQSHKDGAGTTEQSSILPERQQRFVRDVHLGVSRLVHGRRDNVHCGRDRKILGRLPEMEGAVHGVAAGDA